MPKHNKEYGGKDGWTEWIHPLPDYRFSCCDCGLVHDLELAAVDDDGQSVQARTIFRMRRNSRATGQIRRWRTQLNDT